MTADRTRLREVKHVLLVVLLLNLVVAAAKAMYGLWSGSLAVLADAVHSVADAMTNVVGFLVTRFASAPPDADHPYGHRKLEIVAALGIGMAIAVTALRFAWSAIQSLVRGSVPPETSAAGFVILALTLAVNVFVAMYEGRRARSLGSAYLAADAAHTASDVLVTMAVIISLAAVHFDLRHADPVGALVVIAVIARVVWKIARDNISILIDRVAVDRARVEATALAVPGVHGCHRIRSRGTAQAVQLDLHLFVHGDLSIRQGHEICHRVEEALRADMPQIMDVTIHLEPEGDEPEGL